MRIFIALVAIVVSLPALALAQPRWTFCVGASKSGADVWITKVFAAARDREQLESAFEAEEFNRRLGATLHAASEFPPRR
jgi:hypothetical protein